MKETLSLILALTLVSGLAGGLLALTDRVTREPIAQSRRAEMLDAIRRVLPPYDNDPSVSTCAVTDAGQAWTFYVARQDGRFAGAAFEAASDQGYSGRIRILVGVRADDTLNGLEILEQAETPGLGARIGEPDFLRQFAGRPVADTRWAVKKDGGDVDAITGATISPRAVVDALKRGLEVYRRHKQVLAETGR